MTESDPTDVDQLAMVEDTFAEAFPMAGARVIITADDQELATIAANEFCGNASSVIGCDAEAGIERLITSDQSPDGRAGVSVLAFSFGKSGLESAIASRVGQNVLTCPTTACYDGLRDVGLEIPKDKHIKVGGQLRFFGDGFQIAKKLGDRRFWRVPVMDGEFLCDEEFGTVKGIGGGNLILCGASGPATLAAARSAAAAIRAVDDVIMPFPAGIVRSGSKVGSKYAQLKASTNDKFCPTLRGQVETELQDGENAVYEIVIDGLSESAVAKAMQVGLDAAVQSPGLLRVTAGNYGGKLGPHHFHLLRLNEKVAG